jgi:AraC-like DNA-binding protein
MQPAWKRSDIKSNNLFCRLFLSYIFFLILPVVLFFIFINSGLLQYAEDTVDQANAAKLGLVVNNIDAVFKEMRDTAFRIVDDSRVKALFKLEYSNGQFKDMGKLTDAYKIYSDVKKDNPDVVSAYLYDQSRNIIFSFSEGVYPKDKFYDTQWIASYRKAEGEPILAIHDSVDATAESVGSWNQNVITYVLPLEYLNLNGLLAVNIQSGIILKNFFSADGEGSQGYVVIDKSGTVICDTNGRLNDNQIHTSSIVTNVMAIDTGSSGSMVTTAGLNKYLVLYNKASVSGLTIINTIPLNSQFDKIFYYRMLLYIIAGITILLGATISYILSARLYNPVKKVLEKLKSQVIFDPRYKNNELSIISDAINELINSNLKDRQIIENDRQHLRESYVMNLVMGQVTENFTCDFLEKNTCCILVSIDRFDGFSASHSYREQYYYKSLILKVCDQVAALHVKGAGAIMEEDKIALLVSSRDTASEFLRTINVVCDEIVSEISAIKDFTISLGVGGIYADMEDIRKSYVEAYMALKYRLVFGCGSLIQYSAVCNRHGAYNIPSEIQSQLFNHLKLNAIQEVCTLLEEIIGDMKSSLSKETSCDSIMRVFTQLLDHTMEYLAAENIQRDALFGGDRDMTYELMGKETLDDIKDWMVSLFRSIEAYQTASRQRIDENDHVQEIIELIRNNYMDSNLSIEWVAGRLNLSYSHVRKIFKDSIGMNFIDYLNKMRISNAKQLLLETDYTIKDVAIKSGYNNDQCFTRFFKRYEGITPGRYRANWALGQSRAMPSS